MLTFTTTDFDQLRDVLVLEPLEHFGLAKSRDREALLLVLHENLLQRDRSAGLLAASLEHFSEIRKIVRRQ